MSLLNQIKSLFSFSFSSNFSLHVKIPITINVNSSFPKSDNELSNLTPIINIIENGKRIAKNRCFLFNVCFSSQYPIEPPPYFNRVEVQRKKGVQLDSLLWGSHISIIRGSTWDCIDEYHMSEWNYNNNEFVEFSYGDLVTNGVHWWLEVQSKQLEDIRGHFGLKPHPDFGFHITIGKIRSLK